MVSAAEGAEEFYSVENNAARHESLEEARALDKRLVNAWVGHPQFSIVKNTKKGFKTKIDYCLNKVLSFIGMPQASSYTKKFLLVADLDHFEISLPEGIKREVFEIEEIFLITKYGAESNAVRKIGKNDSYTYSHEMKYDIQGEKI